MTFFRNAQFICVFAAALFATHPVQPAAAAETGVGPGQAELVMAERADCIWCRAWHREIGPGYPLSDEGRLAPLRRVDLDKDWPTGLMKPKGIIYTPTFVLIACGREIGRITGYQGADFFYPSVDRLLTQLKPAKHPDGSCA